jgi:hypothetical protein
VKVNEKRVYVAGQSFPFKLDNIEEKIHAMGAITTRWKHYGKIFSVSRRTAPPGLTAALLNLTVASRRRYDM